MPWKAIDLAARAQASAATETSSVHYKVVLPVEDGSAKGWIRFKIVSPKRALERLRIDAFERGNPLEALCSFVSLCPEERFACHLYVSPQVGSVEIHISLLHGQSDDLIVTLRQISFLEYAWQSLRKGALRPISQFVSHFFYPAEPFLIEFNFPSPLRFSGDAERYQEWINSREQALVQSFLSSRAGSTREHPAISVLLPVCDPRPEHLQQTIDSVRAQTFQNWKLCIADDASKNPEIRQILDKEARDDSRISLSYSEQRGGISAATNAAFAQSSAPFVTCLDHDDLLAPVAIEACSRHLGTNPDCRLLFSDEDKIDMSENRFTPFFKPQRFSRELFYSSNYINHLTTHHAATVRQVGGWRSAYDGAQDYDLILRSLETIGEQSIHHIPLVLYHWRAAVGSTALNVGYKHYAIDAGRRALSEHLKRSGVEAEVTQIHGATYRIRRTIARPFPKVSLLIPFRDRGDLLERCISSILGKTSYKNIEIILVDNGSSDAATLRLLERLKSSPLIRIFRDDRPFNYSQLNNLAASVADGEYLCMLNNDTEIITEDWLEEMLNFASVPEVGCVGATLLYPNRTIQHAGVVLGIGGVAAHVFLRRPEKDPGYFGRLTVPANYSAVTGACLMLRRSIFHEVGGLDELELPVAFNDIDLCLKVQARGYRNVVTPFAKLIHHESATRGRESTPEKQARFGREVETMRQRYGDLLDNDPWYSPNLSLDDGEFSLRFERAR